MLCINGRTHSAFKDHFGRLKKTPLGFLIKERLALVASTAVMQPVHFKMLYHHCDKWPGGGLSALDMQPGNTKNAASRGRPSVSNPLSMQEVVSERASDFNPCA